MNDEITIYVCGNDETICDGYVDDSTRSWQDEIATAYVEAACKVIQDARFDDKRDVDHEVSRSFRDWNGGTHAACGGRVGSVAQWGYRIGGVCCHEKDCPQWVRELIEKAETAASNARDLEVERIEAMADEVDA